MFAGGGKVVLYHGGETRPTAGFNFRSVVAFYDDNRWRLYGGISVTARARPVDYQHVMIESCFLSPFQVDGSRLLRRRHSHQRHRHRHRRSRSRCGADGPVSHRRGRANFGQNVKRGRDESDEENGEKTTPAADKVSDVLPV